jgi:hypothetical protein
LLPFSPEPSVFSVAVEKLKNYNIYETTILRVVLYGCETWSLTLKAFEKRVLRRIFDRREMR